jgi:DNA-binding NarL/FixJ family response regulator
VVDGLTDREVADRLVLSTHTVRHHVKRVYQKLDVRSRVELTRLVADPLLPHPSFEGPEQITASRSCP